MGRFSGGRHVKSALCSEVGEALPQASLRPDNLVRGALDQGPLTHPLASVIVCFWSPASEFLGSNLNLYLDPRNPGRGELLTV